MRREGYIHGAAVRVSKDKKEPFVHGKNLFRKPTNQSKCHRYQKNRRVDCKDSDLEPGSAMGCLSASRYMLLGPHHKNKTIKPDAIREFSMDSSIGKLGQINGARWQDDDYDSDRSDCGNSQDDDTGLKDSNGGTCQLRSAIMPLPLDTFIVAKVRSRGKKLSRSPQQIPVGDMIPPDTTGTVDDSESSWVLDFLILEDGSEEFEWVLIPGEKEGITV